MPVPEGQPAGKPTFDVAHLADPSGRPPSRSSGLDEALRLRQVARRILPFVPRRRLAVVLLACAALAAGLLEAAVLVIVARMAVAIAEGQERFALLELVLTRAEFLWLALGLLTLKLLCNFVHARLTARVAARALGTARQAVISAFSGASWQRQAGERVGDLQELMTTQVDRIAGATLVLGAAVSSLLSVIALVVASLAVNPVVAGVTAVAGATLSLLLRPVSARARRLGAEQAEAGKEFASTVTESVALAREVRTFGVTDQMLDRVLKRSSRQTSLYDRSRFLLMLATPLYQSAALLLLIGGMAVASARGSADVSEFGAVVVVLLRVLAYGQQLQGALHQLNDLVPYVDEVARLLDEYKSSQIATGGGAVERLGALELVGVSYAYRNGPPVLRDVTFRIAAGETIGIVGPSGSGKSTLLRILLRLVDPIAGELRAEGGPAAEISLDDWYRHLGFVPQDGQVMHATVADNISFLRPADPAAIVEAARKAHLDDEIRALPDGYGAVLGAGGVNISGGQQQRLCLARALYGRPEVLLLDEPTSALDMLSEVRIQESLAALRGEVTTIIVAHRLSTLSICDRVLVLVDGQVQGFESHERLLATSAFYEEVVRLSTLSL